MEDSFSARIYKYNIERQKEINYYLNPNVKHMIALKSLQSSFLRQISYFYFKNFDKKCRKYTKKHKKPIIEYLKKGGINNFLSSFNVVLDYPPKVQIKKRFYSRGTLRGIRISRLANIPTLYHNCLRSFIKKGVNCLSCIEGKGGGKDIHCIAQNDALFC